MAVTRAKRQQQEALEEEERQQQDLDGAYVSTFSTKEDISDTVCNPENSEMIELAPVNPEEPQVTHATSQTSDQTHDLDQPEAVDTFCTDELQTEEVEVLTPEELGKAQRYDTTLKQIRAKVGEKDSSYYWDQGILKREPYTNFGKALVVLPQVIRVKAL